MIIDIDKEYRILENNFGFFLQRYHNTKNRVKWRTQGQYYSLEAAFREYYRLKRL